MTAREVPPAPESPDVAAARQRGYVSVQQNADEAWARVAALEPLRRVIDAAFPRGAHAVLIAVRDWLAGRESAPVTEPSEAETLALAAVICPAMPDGSVEWCGDGEREIARAVLASTWLAERDQRMRDEGAREALVEVEDAANTACLEADALLMKTGVRPVAVVPVILLRDIHSAHRERIGGTDA